MLWETQTILSLRVHFYFKSIMKSWENWCWCCSKSTCLRWLLVAVPLAIIFCWRLANLCPTFSVFDMNQLTLSRTVACLTATSRGYDQANVSYVCGWYVSMFCKIVQASPCLANVDLATWQGNFINYSCNTADEGITMLFVANMAIPISWAGGRA